MSGEDVKPEVALMRAPRREFSLLPKSLGEAREMAELIARSAFAPKDYKDKPDSVLIAVQMGADVGFSPMQALQNIAVINGRPSVWGDGALALAMPALANFKETVTGEGDDMTATCTLRRKGWESDTVQTFSVRDAKAAGLWGKSGPWSNYPKRMLQMRARSWALRDACADLLMGMGIAEEVMDFPDAIDTTAVVHDATGPSPGDLLEKVSEGLQEAIEKGFTTLNMSAGQRLQKLNEYLAKADTPLDDNAQALIDWLKDEYARRKTGKPRGKAADTSNSNKKQPVPTETVQDAVVVTPAVVEPPAPAAESLSTLVGAGKADTETSATDINWSGPIPAATDGELF
jgi:hypothetical protein